MNGPEHYLAAELLVEDAAVYDAGSDQTTIDMLKIAAAQVHATLAQTAAIAELDAYAAGRDGAATGRAPREAKAWEQVLRPDPPAPVQEIRRPRS